MIFFRKYSIYILLTALSFFAIAPLLQPGFFSIHDDEQVGRLYELDQSLKAGHFPVRISQNLGFGYGYPLFNFYPSFVYYIAEVFVLVGFGYIASIEMMIGLGFLLASFFMYLFSKEYLGKWGGLVAAVAYTYVPYHSVDVYVRGALPEFWSFVFIPAIFWSYKKLADTNKSIYAIVAGIFFCCLILTHNLVAMMSGIFIGIYLLYLLLQTKQKMHFVLKVFVSGIIGLSLSASFWIPSFLERNATMIELLTKELADYNQHFVYIRQFWNSPWGYGGSLYGLEDGLSFQIGKVHIIGSFLAALVGMWLLIKKNPASRIIIVFVFMLGVAAFMITFYSDFIWDTIQVFSYIQFPWRFLLFVAFASSFLLGALLLIVTSEKKQMFLSALLVVIIIISYKDFFAPYRYLTTATDKDYINHDVIRWHTSGLAYEYVPKGIATKINESGVTKIDITKDEIAASSYAVVHGQLAVKELDNKPHYKKFQVTGQGGMLRINTFSFPGWKVFIDDREVTFSDKNKFKLIDVTVSKGEHIVEAKLTDTHLRVVGNVLSGASIIGILLYIIVISRKRRYQPNHEKHTTQKK